MKQGLSLVLLLCLAGCGNWNGGPTPLNRPLHEEREITITCALAPTPGHTNVMVLGESVPIDTIKGTYHYRLWVPKGYLADSQRRWPCLFIMSPLGNASMENMGPWLKSHGYIVVMLVEAQNGPYGPIIGNFLAAHDDVVQRVRIEEGRKIATGVSGGARASSIFVRIRPGFSGLVLQGAGMADDGKGNYYVTGIQSNAFLNVAMTMGSHDDNKGEVERTRTALRATPFLVLNFDGGHELAPPQLFARAMEWIERQQAMQGTATAANPAAKTD